MHAEWPIKDKEIIEITADFPMAYFGEGYFKNTPFQIFEKLDTDSSGEEKQYEVCINSEHRRVKDMYQFQSKKQPEPSDFSLQINKVENVFLVGYSPVNGAFFDMDWTLDIVYHGEGESQVIGTLPTDHGYFKVEGKDKVNRYNPGKEWHDATNSLMSR